MKCTVRVCLCTVTVSLGVVVSNFISCLVSVIGIKMFNSPLMKKLMTDDGDDCIIIWKFY
jgi:hypothetical protein